MIASILPLVLTGVMLFILPTVWFPVTGAYLYLLLVLWDGYRGKVSLLNGHLLGLYATLAAAMILESAANRPITLTRNAEAKGKRETYRFLGAIMGSFYICACLLSILRFPSPAYIWAPVSNALQAVSCLP
jgi:Na+/melibiose symporter-like transporter